MVAELTGQAGSCAQWRIAQVISGNRVKALARTITPC